MADVLKVTPEELRTTATQFKTNMQKMQVGRGAACNRYMNKKLTWNCMLM